MQPHFSISTLALALAVSAAPSVAVAQTPKPKPKAPQNVFVRETTPAPLTPPPEPLISTAAGPSGKPTSTLDARSQQVFALQVALDRAGFSAGEIDARAGSNTDRALRAFQEARGLPVSTAKSPLDSRTTSSLGEAFANPLASYAINDEDLTGPFVNRLPSDMMEKAQLPALAYASIVEMLGERFHVSPALLQRLNPNAEFARGEVIVVPNVEPFTAPGPKAPPTKEGASGEATAAVAGGAVPPTTSAAKPAPGSVTIIVTDSTKTLTVQNAAGELVFHAPVTTGSANDPLPVGEWKVNGVSRNPTFNYNPDLFWDADPSHAKAKLAPGPNNPVGVVWIDLSKEHYGIHGTPEPSRIGHTESHGCIRLTNWDAMRVASMVAPGTKVILR